MGAACQRTSVALHAGAAPEGWLREASLPACLPACWRDARHSRPQLAPSRPTLCLRLVYRAECSSCSAGRILASCAHLFIFQALPLFDPALCPGGLQDRVQYLQRVRKRGDVTEVMFALRADLLRNLGNMTNRWGGLRLRCCTAEPNTGSMHAVVQQSPPRVEQRSAARPPRLPTQARPSIAGLHHRLHLVPQPRRSASALLWALPFAFTPPPPPPPHPPFHHPPPPPPTDPHPTPTHPPVPLAWHAARCTSASLRSPT